MQQSLFDYEPERFTAWKKFHRSNPQIYRYFVRFAEQALYNGRSRIGARMIGERIRWYTSVQTNDPIYKINDHHWPYYARLLMLTDERFAGFFQRRDENFDATDEMIKDAE
jgi:hypothetical protein